MESINKNHETFCSPSQHCTNQIKRTLNQTSKLYFPCPVPTKQEIILPKSSQRPFATFSDIGDITVALQYCQVEMMKTVEYKDRLKLI